MGPFLDLHLENVLTSHQYGDCMKLTVVVSLFNPHAMVSWC